MRAGHPDPLGELVRISIDSDEFPEAMGRSLRIIGIVTAVLAPTLGAVLVMLGLPAKSPRVDRWASTQTAWLRPLVSYDHHALWAGAALAGLALAAWSAGVGSRGWQRGPGWMHLAVIYEAVAALLVALPLILAFIAAAVALALVVAIGAVCVVAAIALLVAFMSG